MPRNIGRFAAVLVLVSGAALAVPAQAGLTLTAAGIADGFGLAVFANNFTSECFGGPTSCAGPGGIATTGDGHILVQDIVTGNVEEFQDANGQDAAHPLNSANVSGSFAGMTNAGGHAFFMDQNSGLLVQLQNNGAIDFTHPFLRTSALGLATNPVNQHIITSFGLDVDPNPVNWFSPQRFTTACVGDGVAVSSDGATAYFAEGSDVVGCRIATGAQVFDSGAMANGPDGIGVISGGAFNGDLVVNGVGGEVVMLDPSTDSQVVIANGGSRGDFVGQDLNNGSLLLTQSDEVDRLTCRGCNFSGTPPQPAPEPSTLPLLAAALAGWAMLGRVAIARRGRTTAGGTA